MKLKIRTIALGICMLGGNIQAMSILHTVTQTVMMDLFLKPSTKTLKFAQRVFLGFAAIGTYACLELCHKSIKKFLSRIELNVINPDVVAQYSQSSHGPYAFEYYKSLERSRLSILFDGQEQSFDLGKDTVYTITFYPTDNEFVVVSGENRSSKTYVLQEFNKDTSALDKLIKEETSPSHSPEKHHTEAA